MFPPSNIREPQDPYSPGSGQKPGPRESRVRLGIMSVLTGAGQSDFNTLKSMLGVSDGNLASHIKALEELGYIETIKQFIGRKPNTSYSVTEAGKKAFSAHIEALTSLLGIK